MQHSLTLRIPLGTARQAQIMLRAIEPNREPRKDLLTRTLSVDESAGILEAHFASNELKVLRVSVNNFLESVALVTRTLRTFDDTDSL